jgi:amidase
VGPAPGFGGGAIPIPHGGLQMAERALTGEGLDSGCDAIDPARCADAGFPGTEYRPDQDKYCVPESAPSSSPRRSPTRSPSLSGNRPPRGRVYPAATMLDRRSFLALVPVGVAITSGCTPRVPTASPTARSVGDSRTPGQTSMPPAPFPEFEEVTLTELGARLTRGELTALDLVDRYLARIEALDRRGPALRAVIEVNPDARAIAAQLDAERRAGKARGVLHGVPLLLKDNIDTGDRMATTAGSLALEGSPAPRDAGIAARLREAGAVLLGKTNLSEWANLRSSRSTSGWSGRGGLTRHPYALDRNTSGSSSGSAAAAAANLCAAAIGTETDGSIVSPASICGLVGLKPTVGLVSRAGIIPISHTQDTAGPMTRTVADAALLLSALVGPDPRDPATVGQPPRSDYLAALDKDGLRGRRLGVVRSFTGIPQPALDVFDAALADLRRLGAVLVDPVDLGSVAKLEAPELEVLLFELKADMAAYLAERRHSGGARSVGDLVAFNAAHASQELQWFGQEYFVQAAAKGSLETPAYREALATCRRLSRDEGIDAALKAHGLDALVAITGGPAWLTDLVNGDASTGTCSTPAAVAGYPHLTVPAGALHGLPIGISFFAGAYSEAMLLRCGYAYEQATKRRERPRFLSTAVLGS